MELDKRIIEGKSYLDCFDIEVAKEFIGKECYLSDSVASFANIDNLKKATLIEVDDGDIYPYKLETTRWHYGSLFILPCAWVKEPEKKYKVFSLEKFLEIFKVGDLIIYRENGSTEVHHKMLTGYTVYDGRYDIPGTGMVTLGINIYTLGYLFNTYELFLNGKWQPFGIEE